MSIYTKYELASVKRKTPLLIPAGYFIVNTQKQVRDFLSKIKQDTPPSPFSLLYLPQLLHPEILL